MQTRKGKLLKIMKNFWVGIKRKVILPKFAENSFLN